MSGCREQRPWSSLLNSVCYIAGIWTGTSFSGVGTVTRQLGVLSSLGQFPGKPFSSPADGLWIEAGPADEDKPHHTP